MLITAEIILAAWIVFLIVLIRTSPTYRRMALISLIAFAAVAVVTLGVLFLLPVSDPPIRF